MLTPHTDIYSDVDDTQSTSTRTIPISCSSPLLLSFLHFTCTLFLKPPSHLRPQCQELPPKRIQAPTTVNNMVNIISLEQISSSVYVDFRSSIVSLRCLRRRPTGGRHALSHTSLFSQTRFSAFSRQTSSPTVTWGFSQGLVGQRPSNPRRCTQGRL